MKEEIYIVGGYVRDRLMGIKSNDIDFTFVLCNPDTSETNQGFLYMKQWLINEGFTIFLETPDMGTIRAKFPKTSKTFQGETADFVLARKEVKYADDSRHPQLEIGTLYDDLFRRDFTVNAIAMDMNGKYIDFFGGLEDVSDKVLRTPDDPMKTMMDDPLRVLRAMRFSITKGFSICEPLMTAMKNQAVLDKLFRVVSRERVREELTKMFKASTAKTIRFLVEFDNDIPSKGTGIIDRLFENGLWLKPTIEKT